MRAAKSESKKRPATSGEPFVCFFVLVSLLTYALRAEGRGTGGGSTLLCITFTHHRSVRISPLKPDPRPPPVRMKVASVTALVIVRVEYVFS